MDRQPQLADDIPAKRNENQRINAGIDQLLQLHRDITRPGGNRAPSRRRIWIWIVETIVMPSVEPGENREPMIIGSAGVGPPFVDKLACSLDVCRTMAFGDDGSVGNRAR